jgi:octaprenyl-diphosphate synthase
LKRKDVADSHMDRDAPTTGQFKDHFDAINRQLSQVFDSRVPLVEDMGKHTLLGQGKRLRPLLFVLSSHLCGRYGKELYQFSTIFEYIHSASLLHDDVLDNAEMRRKRPSANQVWGNHAAVLEGDFLYSKALTIGIRTSNIPFLTRLTETTLRMTEGQILEFVHTNDWGMTKDQYMEIIAAKTAVLISAACACGAIIAGADAAREASLAEFGRQGGIAFQLMDDLLDYTSSERVFGKPVGKDLREGKVTLPLIYTLLQLDAGEKKRVIDLLATPDATDADYQGIMDMVRRSGALDRIREEAQGFVDRATDCLGIFPDSATKRDLINLSQHIIDREY